MEKKIIPGAIIAAATLVAVLLNMPLEEKETAMTSQLDQAAAMQIAENRQ